MFSLLHPVFVRTGGTVGYDEVKGGELYYFSIIEGRGYPSFGGLSLTFDPDCHMREEEQTGKRRKETPIL